MRLLVAVYALSLAGCCDGGYGPAEANGERMVAFDAVFHQDPRWLGGDGAYSIDLGGDQVGHERTLWLFGDSFIATSDAHVRTESTMVRNSIAVMTGRDLARAQMEFAWRDGTPPTSFFPEEGDHWFWPSEGVQVPNGPVVVFLSEERPTPNQGLGFAGAGFRAVRIADTAGVPATWTLAPTAAHAPSFAPDGNVACGGVDGDHYVALVTSGDDHAGRMARWSFTALASGDLATPEWWTGSGWTSETALTETPAVVIDHGATECSLTYSEFVAGWIYVASDGFGATTIATRTAPAITGPWAELAPAFTPDESKVPNAFVYAAKGHALFTDNPTQLMVTFADNSFMFADLFDPAKSAVLYWPHVVVLSFFGTVAC